MFIKYINPTLFRLDITIPRNYYIQSSSIFFKNNTFFFKFLLFMNLWLNYKLKKLNYYLVKFNLFQKNKNLILYCSIFSKNLLELQQKKKSWYLNELRLKSFKKRTFYKQHVYNIIKNKMLNTYLEKAILKFIPNKPFKVYLQNIIFKHMFSISNTAQTSEFNFYKNIYMKYFFYNLLIRLQNNIFSQKKKNKQIANLYSKFIRSRYKIKYPDSVFQKPFLFLLHSAKQRKEREQQRIQRNKKLRLAHAYRQKFAVPKFKKKFKKYLKYDFQVKTRRHVKKFLLLKQYKFNMINSFINLADYERPEKYRYKFYQHINDKMLSPNYINFYTGSSNWWLHIWLSYSHFSARRTSLVRMKRHKRALDRSFVYNDLPVYTGNFFNTFKKNVFKTYKFAFFLLFNYVRLHRKFPPKRKTILRGLSSKPTSPVVSSKLALRFHSKSPKNTKISRLSRRLKLFHYPFTWSQINFLNKLNLLGYHKILRPRGVRQMRRLIRRFFKAQGRFMGTQLRHVYRRRPGPIPEFQYKNPWHYFLRKSRTYLAPNYTSVFFRYFIRNPRLLALFKQVQESNSSVQSFNMLDKSAPQRRKYRLRSIFYKVGRRRRPRPLRSKKSSTSRQIFWVNKEIVDLNKNNIYNSLKKSTNDAYAIDKTLFLPFYSCLFITQRLPYRLRRSRRFFYNSLVKLLLYGFLEKAPSLIFFFIELFFKNSKRHVQLLKSFNSFFYIFFRFKFITDTCNIDGLKIIIKGKFNGRRRKRFFILNFGKTSFQDSSIPIYHYSDQLVTYTGIFGVRISLFCKKRIYDVRKF